MKKIYNKFDYEILFQDSPEYFLVKNARMFQEDKFVRFVTFNEDDYIGDEWYPIKNIYRIKRRIGGFNNEG